MGTKHHPRVTLTREHRDAIYEEIESVVHLGDDLPIYLADGEFDPSDRDWLKAFSWKTGVCVRLLDQLGWQRQGDRDSYELEVDQNCARFMEDLDSRARGALKDDSRDAAEDRAAYARLGVGFTDEQ
jgi:hypothetical protein